MCMIASHTKHPLHWTEVCCPLIFLACLHFTHCHSCSTRRQRHLSSAPYVPWAFMFTSATPMERHAKAQLRAHGRSWFATSMVSTMLRSSFVSVWKLRGCLHHNGSNYFRWDGSPPQLVSLPLHLPSISSSSFKSLISRERLTSMISGRPLSMMDANLCV